MLCAFKAGCIGLSAAVLVVIAFAVGFGFTRLLIRWARRAGLVQVPNARSSHVVPTPTGGGLAIAVAVVCCGLVLATTSQFPATSWLWLFLGGAMAGLGFADDAYDLSPAVRFVSQTVIVTVTIVTLSPMPPLELLLGYELRGSALGLVLIIAGVWWINLFNFMDGIDGLAGSQALIILGSALALWLLIYGGAVSDPVWVLAAISCSATLGFLLNNWPPARIFMGDAGSNFLSFIMLIVMLTLIVRDVMGYGGALTLTSVFLSDATVTVVRRTGHGERPWSAHRRHAYQRLSRRFGHMAVATAYGLLTLLWALPLTLLGVLWRNLEWITAAIAVTPLVIAAVALGAGSRSEG